MNSFLIDTIVLCGADESVIHQMLQDQTLYNFKTVVINNNILPVKSNLECWKWFKEEIQLIEGL